MIQQRPTKKEFVEGYEIFEQHYSIDGAYKVVRYMLPRIWNNTEMVAVCVCMLLFDWNRRFYGSEKGINFNEIKKCIADNIGLINIFKKSDIFSLKSENEPDIKKLFNDFLNASAHNERKTRRGEKYKSGVSVAKALHVLAPVFFPLWDNDIAKGYNQKVSQLKNADEYICFCKKIKEVAKHVNKYEKTTDIARLIKLIDEYNFKEAKKLRRLY